MSKNKFPKTTDETWEKDKEGLYDEMTLNEDKPSEQKGLKSFLKKKERKTIGFFCCLLLVAGILSAIKWDSERMTPFTETEYEVVKETLMEYINGDSLAMSEVEDLVKESIERTTSQEQANDLVISYITELSRYGSYLYMNLSSYSSQLAELDETYDVTNGEGIMTLSDGLLKTTLTELFRYPFTLQKINDAYYVSIDYDKVINMFDSEISNGFKTYLQVFQEEYSKSLFDEDGKYDIDKVLDRLNTIESYWKKNKDDVSWKEWALLYGDVLNTITGVNQETWYEETEGNYPVLNSTVESKIANYAKETSDTRIKADLEAYLQILDESNGYLDSKAIDKILTMRDFYDISINTSLTNDSYFTLEYYETLNKSITSEVSDILGN